MLQAILMKLCSLTYSEVLLMEDGIQEPLFNGRELLLVNEMPYNIY